MHHVPKPAELPQEPLREPALNPTKLDKPSFLMNVPFSLSTDVANNAWMEDIPEEERDIDLKKALRQFLEVYHFIAADAVVYLLPTPNGRRLQDLVYTANMGIVLEHLPDKNTVVLSNFKSVPRVGEAEVGKGFFEAMGYDVHVPPFKFEGEAELKHLYDNVYIGGYGIRSDKRTYEWMAKNFDMKIICLEEVEPYLYHLDCTVFPLTPENTLVCTEMFTKREVTRLEKYTNIIDVTADECFSGICNSVRLANGILNASNIHDLKPGDELYEGERDKNRKLEDVATSHGFEVNFFNLSEYYKSGALLSCMIMHLNRKSYDFTLL